MLYRMQEGVLTLEGEWRDQSIQVLVPTDTPGRGVNLVVARDVLPLGMTLIDYMAQQRLNFHKQLAGLEVEMDTAGVLDGRPAQFMEISWLAEGRPLHQLIATVLDEKNGILTFTASIPDAVDAEVRRRLMQVISGFRFDAPLKT